MSQMLLQTNSYIVPKERRAEHARLLRRFRQVLLRLGCDLFEVYEQLGPNWSTGDSSGRFVQIIRFRDRKHQREVHAAEQSDPAAQQLIAEFCELVNLPYQQQQGMLAIGYYQGVIDVPASAITRQTPPAPAARRSQERAQGGFGFGAPSAPALGVAGGTTVGFGAAAFDAATQAEDEGTEESEESQNHASAEIEAVGHEDTTASEEQDDDLSPELSEAAYAEALDNAAETLDHTEQDAATEGAIADEALTDDEQLLDDEEHSDASPLPAGHAEQQGDDDGFAELLPAEDLQDALLDGGTAEDTTPTGMPVLPTSEGHDVDASGLEFQDLTDNDEASTEAFGDPGVLTSGLTAGVPDAQETTHAATEPPQSSTADANREDAGEEDGEEDGEWQLVSDLGDAEVDPLEALPAAELEEAESGTAEAGGAAGESSAYLYGLDAEPESGSAVADVKDTPSDAPAEEASAGDAELPMNLVTDEGEIEILSETLPEMVPASARPERHESGDGHDEIEAALNEALRD